jgi:glycosyltransferase involved in cell wall biosynthesis
MSLRALCITSHHGSISNVRPEAEWFIGLQKAGIELTVMTGKDTVYADRMRDAGIEIIDFEISRRYSLIAIRKIRQALRARSIQILHLFNNRTITNGIVAALGLPVKVITYRGQTGNIKRRDPTCYLTHLNPRVDFITCVADAVRLDLIANGVPAGMLATVYKGHDIHWYDDTPKADLQALGIPPGAFVVGCVANNRPRKGVPVLIEAARYLPADSRLHILLVGNGMDGMKVTTLVGESPLAGNFHLLGYRDNVLELVAACDATVLPATRREGLPKTVIESMGLGIAPIVTATGGSPELVVDGETGLVVPPGDARALAQALMRLEQNRDECAAMGVASRARLATHFNLEQGVEAMRKVYESLANGRA